MNQYRFVFTKEDISDEEQEIILEEETDEKAIKKFFSIIGGFNHFGCHVSDGRIFTSQYGDWNKNLLKINEGNKKWKAENNE